MDEICRWKDAAPNMVEMLKTNKVTIFFPGIENRPPEKNVLLSIFCLLPFSVAASVRKTGPDFNFGHFKSSNQESKP
jgi:hypothetical protein